MSYFHNVRVFISHSWQYSGHYETLAQWIFRDAWKINGVPICFENMSVPRDDPIHNAPTDAALLNSIERLIIQSNVVVIPTGMYASCSKWIGKELSAAESFGKPILAVNPWGQERKSSFVQQNANLTVGWNRKSVVDAVLRLANGSN